MQISFRVLLSAFVNRLQQVSGGPRNEDPATFLVRITGLQMRIIDRIFREKNFFLGTCNKGNKGAPQRVMSMLDLNKTECTMLYLALEEHVFVDQEHLAIIQSLSNHKKKKPKVLLLRVAARAVRFGCMDIDWVNDWALFEKLAEVSKLGKVARPKAGKVVRKVEGVKLAILEQVLIHHKVVAEDIYQQFESDCDSHLGIQRHIDALNEELKNNIVYVRDSIKNSSEFRIMKFYLSGNASQNDNHRQLVYLVKKSVQRKRLQKQDVVM